MCTIDKCEREVHSKGLCQNHYRQEQRKARGLKKPGPKPNPEAPRSRYGEARKNEGNGYRTNFIGGTCRKGHLLTEETAKVQTSGYINCRICTNNADRRRRGSVELDYLGTANKHKTHCSQGHELAGDNLYTHPTMGYRRCITCHTTTYRKWYLKETYDITIEVFEEMIEAQDNKCLGCNKEFDNNIKVDHNHTTGAVRGLLCNGCNIALGHVYDDPKILYGLIEYLESFSQTTSTD